MCKVEEGEEMDEGEEEGEGVDGTANAMDGMEISEGPREPEVDEDGFQMVSKKKGGRKK